MDTLGRDQSNDPDWEKVRVALDDPSWDFRTIQGLVEDTALPPDRVEAALARHKGEVRTSLVPDKLGRTLYTRASRPTKTRELLYTLRALVSGST